VEEREGGELAGFFPSNMTHSKLLEMKVIYGFDHSFVGYMLSHLLLSMVLTKSLSYFSL
jgi:hypothetical protein